MTLFRWIKGQSSLVIAGSVVPPWMPVINSEWIRGFLLSGIYLLCFTGIIACSSGSNGGPTADVDIGNRVPVSDVDAGTAPAFTSPRTVTVEEKTLLAYTATATGADGKALTFSLTGGADQSLFGIDAVTGMLSFNTAPDFDAPADSDSNNKYIVQLTVSDGTYQVSQSVTIDVEPEPTISLDISTPTNGQLVEAEIYVSASVQSDFDISAVMASVENKSTNLSYSSEAVCLSPLFCQPGFSGNLVLDDMAPGSYDLTVTVQDSFGSTVSEQRTIVIDSKPFVTITKPLQFSVARPDLPLDISCKDDLGNCEISVEVGNKASPIASGVNTLTETLDLSAYDGQKIALGITVTDSSNQVTKEKITIYVEPSENLLTIGNFPGRVIDFDGERALILISGDHGESLNIQDLTSGIVTDVEVPVGLLVSTTRSFLSPTGAIYTTHEVGGTSLTARIYDWNDSNLLDMGRPDSAASLTVAGDYAIWSEGQLLWIRQFSTKTNTPVSTSAGNWRNSVASNGVVGYWAYPDYSIESSHAGVNTTLASDMAYWNTYVLTDGKGFVYRKHDACCGYRQYSITFHDGDTELALTNFRDEEPFSGRDYTINKGWIAFTELGGAGQTNVWTRDPSGTLMQRTVFGSASIIDALSPAGEVMLLNAGTRYLSNAAGQSSSVSSALGISTNINDTWFIYIGRSLFELSLRDDSGNSTQ